jgi:hypothetical protein
MGAFCSIPVALTAGLIKGSVYGPKNAIVHSIDKPFSKDTFSLGNLEGEEKSAKSNELQKGDVEKPESQPWGTHK